MTILYTLDVLDDGSQLLTGFTGTPTLDLTDRRQLVDGVHAILPEAEVLDVWAHDWAADEFELGAWTYYKPGEATSRLKELQRPQGRLTFASSDIANGWPGFMDGAIESGIRAARQLQRLV